MSEQNFRDLVRYVMANPFITQASVQGVPTVTHLGGYLTVPPGKDVRIVATFSTPRELRTKLLVGTWYPGELLLDGKVVGKVNGMGKAPVPDAESVDVVLSAGKHTLEFHAPNSALGNAVYLRFVDPDRVIEYPDSK
jgi:hypothetical protein